MPSVQHVQLAVVPVRGLSLLTVVSRWQAHVRLALVLEVQYPGVASVVLVEAWAKSEHLRPLKSTYHQVRCMLIKFTYFFVLTFLSGVEDGMTIRIPKAGDAPVTGKGTPGDLFVRVSVAPSKQFTRQGANLFHEVKVPFHTALLGGRVRVPTIDGDVDVRLPGGTQQGEEMVLKGRGVPEVRNGLSGDLYVTFSVVLPR